MTDPYTDAATPTADDIIDDDTTTAALDRQADAIIAQSEGRAFQPTTSLRKAVREDLHEGRLWARSRADRTAEVIREEPLKATAYALGVGLLIGLLLRR